MPWHRRTRRSRPSYDDLAIAEARLDSITQELTHIVSEDVQGSVSSMRDTVERMHRLQEEMSPGRAVVIPLQP